MRVKKWSVGKERGTIQGRKKGGNQFSPNLHYNPHRFYWQQGHRVCSHNDHEVPGTSQKGVGMSLSW